MDAQKTCTVCKTPQSQGSKDCERCKLPLTVSEMVHLTYEELTTLFTKYLNAETWGEVVWAFEKAKIPLKKMHSPKPKKDYRMTVSDIVSAKAVLDSPEDYPDEEDALDKFFDRMDPAFEAAEKYGAPVLKFAGKVLVKTAANMLGGQTKD